MFQPASSHLLREITAATLNELPCDIVLKTETTGVVIIGISFCD